MVCTLKSVGIFFKYSPKRRWELEQCIVIGEEGRERTNEASLGLDSDTSTDDDNDSEDEEYEDGWNATPHSKTSKTCMDPFCYVWKLFPLTKAEGNGIQSPRACSLGLFCLFQFRNRGYACSIGGYSYSGIWTEYYCIHSAPDSRMDGIVIWRENCASAPEAAFKNGGFVYDRHEHSWLVFVSWSGKKYYCLVERDDISFDRALQNPWAPLSEDKFQKEELWLNSRSIKKLSLCSSWGPGIGLVRFRLLGSQAPRAEDSSLVVAADHSFCHSHFSCFLVSPAGISDVSSHFSVFVFTLCSLVSLVSLVV